MTTQRSTKPYVAATPWLDPKAVPFIQIKNLSKQFDKFTAVDKVNLDIYQGELFTILGGSGCGKSTLLRMLAGFEEPSAGQIIIDGVDMANIPAYDRPINMMFQSYAVFPHMTVEQNIGYGLKKDNLPKAEIATRVKEMLDLVQLGDLAARKPHHLSGGQRQRVALARALIKQPKVLLLDEPLAALDKKLREQTQFELINLQYELGITFVVVTHDQEEAMTLSDRLAVMNTGKFIQTGTPTQVYESPINRFVADFFGTINFFNATVISSDPAAKKLSAKLEKTGTKLDANSETAFAEGAEVTIAVRPEKIIISQKRPDGDHITITKGTVEDLAYYGNRSLYRIRSQSGRIIQVSAQNYQRSEALTLEWDDEVFLSWDSSCNVVLSE
ncbi:MAG: ABC transporter ATP-binding protein [Porticoccaceae bacterium]|nr:ABC transporter ATP-binding protein [Porticoccaceae bacterium]